jgi:molybdate transport system ATP-binding protein
VSVGTADSAVGAARGTGLHAEVAVHLGDFDLDVSLFGSPGETVAVLGPNGAGKTTLLRCLAGLQPIDRGRIVVDGTVLDAAEGSGAATFVPPQQRGVGVVFQQHLLFPAMSVTDNVAFGLRARGVAKATARARASELLAVVGLEGRGGDRPAVLSGGQSQRVALARALAIDPSLLLLDEPLAALDASTRSEIRRELRRHLDALDHGVRLVVTHDPVDAFALAERVVVIEDGRVTHDGPLSEIAARPRTRYVADLIGVNLYPGTVGSPGVVTIGAAAGADRFDLVVAGDAAGAVFVVVHPRAVSLHRHRGEGSPRNVWSAPITDVDLERDRARVRLAGPLPITAEITTAAAAELALRPGEEVWVSVKATEVEVYER